MANPYDTTGMDEETKRRFLAKVQELNEKKAAPVQAPGILDSIARSQGVYSKERGFGELGRNLNIGIKGLKAIGGGILGGQEGAKPYINDIKRAMPHVPSNVPMVSPVTGQEVIPGMPPVGKGAPSAIPPIPSAQGRRVGVIPYRPTAQELGPEQIGPSAPSFNERTQQNAAMFGIRQSGVDPLLNAQATLAKMGRERDTNKKAALMQQYQAFMEQHNANLQRQQELAIGAQGVQAQQAKNQLGLDKANIAANAALGAAGIKQQGQMTQEQLHGINMQKAKVYDAYSKGMITPDQLNEQLANIDTAANPQQAQDQGGAQESPALADARRRMAEFNAKKATMSPEDVQKIMHSDGYLNAVALMNAHKKTIARNAQMALQ